MKILMNKMVQNDEYCNDILIQLSAIENSVKSLSNHILENHIYSCVSENYFTIDVELLKGCLEYATSYCRNMEELTAERKRLIPIFKELKNDWSIVYSQKDFDVKKLFDSVMGERKRFFQSEKSDSKIFTTDEVGKATVNRPVSRTDKALETTNEAQMQSEINIAK